jgi:hypothetical protein
MSNCYLKRLNYEKVLHTCFKAFGITDEFMFFWIYNRSCKSNHYYQSVN